MRRGEQAASSFRLTVYYILLHACSKDKQATTFRMTRSAGQVLEQLAEADGISQTAMLEIAIWEAAKKRGVCADSGVQDQAQQRPAARD